MSEFKKGDKVTALTQRNDPSSRREYTLAEDVAPDHERYDIVRAFEADGKPTHVWAATIEPFDDTPPKVGDRVRLVHEGVVTGTSSFGGGHTLLIDGYARVLGHGETVEILERARKPYATGSVAMGDLGPLVRFKDGRWLSTNITAGGAFERLEGLTDDAIRDGAQSKRYEIVYEPPTSRN